MHPTLRKFIILLLTVVFLGSAAKIIYQMMDYHRGNEIYAEAEALAGLPDLSSLPLAAPPSKSEDDVPPPPGEQEEPGVQEEAGEQSPTYVDPYADALRNMDFTALREINQDVLGWVLIPGTPVSYPVVQGTDNSYYLNHTWRKGRNLMGAIFLESTNSRDLSDFNTIVYGHRMNNRSMFGTLHEYSTLSYWEEHPYIYLTDQSGTGKYEIFAAYEVSITGDTYRLGFSSGQSKQDFLDFCLAQSLIDTGVVPSINDRILTLSTCTGNGYTTRWVVQAALKGTDPGGFTQQPTPEEEPSPANHFDTDSSDAPLPLPDPSENM